jgi:hypothetical protein
MNEWKHFCSDLQSKQFISVGKQVSTFFAVILADKNDNLIGLEK